MNFKTLKKNPYESVQFLNSTYSNAKMLDISAQCSHNIIRLIYKNNYYQNSMIEVL